MVKMPKIPTASTAEAIYKNWELNAGDWRRPHLGASVIGHECRRNIFYVYRWAYPPHFPGRMLRLFDRGFREEPVFINELRRIGCTVWDKDPDTGKQFLISHFGGHFGGSGDAVVLGLPESQKTPHAVDFKTFNDKTFKELERKGVEKAKPQHVTQLQIYMEGFGVKRAAHIAVNKNDDRIRIERIKFDPKAAKLAINLACDIIFNSIPPSRISDDPTFYVCKFCNHHDVCHGNANVIASCRTCVHGCPIPKDTMWNCGLHKKDLTIPEQKAGCRQYERAKM